MNFTLKCLRKHSDLTCTVVSFCIKAVTDIEASESKFKMHYHDRVVCPICMYTACDSMYFVRAAAGHTISKKQKCDLERTLNDPNKPHYYQLG